MAASVHSGQIAASDAIRMLQHGGNPTHLGLALTQLRQAGYPVLDADVARLHPYWYAHINVHGHYTFHHPAWTTHRRPLRDPTRTPTKTECKQAWWGLSPLSESPHQSCYRYSAVRSTLEPTTEGRPRPCRAGTAPRAFGERSNSWKRLK